MTTNNFKPILFSTEMVQAILAGRKTQTRRVVKKQPINEGYRPRLFNGHFNELYLEYRNTKVIDGDVTKSKIKKGDILWVRETFSPGPFEGGKKTPFIYKADGDRSYKISDTNFTTRWKPSLLMPKEAARIFLKVTNVRVERLQDISENDAIAEGIDFFNHGYGGSPVGIWYRNYKYGTNNCSPKYSFQTLWDSINAKKHPWESNPWVWVYEFERIEKPENFI